MMVRIVECVPNFSEGRNPSVIEAIAGGIRAVKGVQLLNVDPGADFHRTVYTFVGEPDAVLEAAFQAAKIGTALIDMTQHKGEHARMGALDVMPFIPIQGVTMEDCIELSKKFGKRMASKLGIPVFLYANAATKPDRVRLPSIRKGEYEALEKKFKDPSFAPDFGEPVFVPKSGATATGAREILIAYNINLNTADKSIASTISGRLRTSGVVNKDKDGNTITGPDGKPERIPGRFNGVQAGGMMYDEHTAQVSMNLLNYHEVNLHDVFEATKEEAEKLGVKVTGSEIVGLVPKESLLKAGRFYAEKGKVTVTDEGDLVTLAIDHLDLSDLYPFKPKEKIIEYMMESSGHLASMTLKEFLSELASSSPAPGGGSVAALAGSLGAALTSMVCHLTIGKENYADVQGEIKQTLASSEKLRQKLMLLIDRDTDAFNEVMKAFKLPKETEEQRVQRSRAIQEGYKAAAMVPLETAKTCAATLDTALVAAEKGNRNSITDAGVAALLGRSGVHAAVLNVSINLGSIKDKAFVKKIETELETLETTAENKEKSILDRVRKSLT
jgi:glutamate formiminotransferase/formiminotetrahydrofolate cyclodeaminase